MKNNKAKFKCCHKSVKIQNLQTFYNYNFSPGGLLYMYFVDGCRLHKSVHAHVYTRGCLSLRLAPFVAAANISELRLEFKCSEVAAPSELSAEARLYWLSACNSSYGRMDMKISFYVGLQRTRQQLSADGLVAARPRDPLNTLGSVGGAAQGWSRSTTDVRRISA